MTPSCCIISTTLKASQLSTILPPDKRKMPKLVTAMRFPIAAMPMNFPRCLAYVVQRTATLSPSATISSMTLRVSGKASRHSPTARLRFSGPDKPGGEGLWSTWSAARTSSAISWFPVLKSSSMSWRVTALFPSDTLSRGFFLLSPLSPPSLRGFLRYSLLLFGRELFGASFTALTRS